jgi:FdhD protein
MSIKVPVRRVGEQEFTEESDRIAVEEPLEIRLRYTSNGAPTVESIAITMRTPGDEFDLATGFLFTEGIIRRASDIEALRYIDDEKSEVAYRNIVEVELLPEIGVDIGRLHRHFYATSSCGVCGKTSLNALKVQSMYEGSSDDLHLQPDVLSAIPEALGSKQSTFLKTGGLHAAALFNADGRILDIREDVGRHNAMDKLIGGALHRDQLPLLQLGIVVSGRTSFELMQKAHMAGCPLVVAVGAPSSLAVDLAWEFDMTLVGFLRDGRFNVYAGPSRIE